MKEILFFVFTCVKDGREYIRKLFDSMLSQTKINFVHYIYEDGSNNPLGELVDEYKKKAATLPTPYEVIYEKNDINFGLNYATRHCIEQCNCDYFIWIDCDNWIEKDFFEKIGQAVTKKQKYDLIRTKLVTHPPSQNTQTIYNNRKKELEMFLRTRYYYSFFAVKYRTYKSINPNIIFSNDKYFFNDDQVLLLLLCSDINICYVERAIGHFLLRGNQESGNNIIIEDGKESQLSYLKKISNEKYIFIKNYYELKDKTREVELLINHSPLEAWNVFSSVINTCKKYKFPYGLLNYKSKIYCRIRIIKHILLNKQVRHEK